MNEILTSIGQTFTDDQISKMVARVDKDNDGRLNFDGKNWLNYNKFGFEIHFNFRILRIINDTHVIRYDYENKNMD